jgi:hypothetical protein
MNSGVKEEYENNRTIIHLQKIDSNDPHKGSGFCPKGFD